MTDRKHRFCPVVEELEGRLCLSSIPTSVTARLDSGILTVQGTRGPDVIKVNLPGRQILARGRAYSSSSVHRIVILGEGGSDWIKVSGAILQPTRIFGGSGKDIIAGGGGSDEIDGGDGADTLSGRGGDDVIYGGPGRDILKGGPGTNRVYQGNPSRTDGSNTAIELEIIRLTNLQRTTRGLPALRVSAQLNEAAAHHSSNMATLSNTIGLNAALRHTLYGTPLPSITNRMDYVGYDYRSLRENIAYGYRSAAEVVAGWMNSAGHQANILASDVTEIGVSVQSNAASVLFFTQDFGAPW